MVINRFYDCTPVRLRFGALTGQLQKHARYAIKDEATGRWHLVDFATYRKAHPQSDISYGVLDVFAHSLQVHVANTVDKTAHGYEFAAPVHILENGTASAIMGSTEQAFDHYSRSGVRDLCRSLPWLIYQESADADSSNRRKRSCTLEDLPENGLGVESTCCAHQGHRLVESREKLVIGDVFAIWCAFSNHHNQNKILAQFWLLLADVQVRLGHPDKKELERHEWILQKTVLRTDGYTDIDANGAGPHEAVQNDLQIFNGNWACGTPEY